MKQRSYRLGSSTMLLFWGFFLAFFHLDVSYLTYITQVSSMILLWSGFHRLKDVNRELHHAFIAVTVYLILGMAGLFLLAIPGEYQGLLILPNIIFFSLILYWYGLGMKLWVIHLQGENLPQGRRIFIEYLMTLMLAFVGLASESIAIMGVILAIPMYILMITQIYHIHKRIKAVEPEDVVKANSIPGYLVMIGYVLVLAVGIPLITYQLSRQDSLSYDKWETHLGDERNALVEKGLHEELVQDLSDSIIMEIKDAKSFYELNNQSQEMDVVQYAGLLPDGSVCYLGYYHLDKEQMQGSIMFGMDGNMDENQRSLYEIAVLYDQDLITYGHSERYSFDFKLNKGEQHRQYIYARSISEESELIPIFTNVYYQSSWFQYPYSSQSITDSVGTQMYMGFPTTTTGMKIKHRQNQVLVDVRGLKKEMEEKPES